MCSPLALPPFMFENFIAGRWAPPVGGRWLSLAAPGSGRAGRVARAEATDVAHAAAAAAAALRPWRRLGADGRAAALAEVPRAVALHTPVLTFAEAWDRTEPPPRCPGPAVGRGGVNPAHPRAATADAAPGCPVLRPPPADQAVPRAPAVLRLARCADADPDTAWECLAPLLGDGHVAVVLLLYCEARRLPVRLLTRLGLAAAALPAGVLNLLTGLGLEAGLALATDPLTAWPPGGAAPPARPSH